MKSKLHPRAFTLALLAIAHVVARRSLQGQAILASRSLAFGF